MFLNVDKPYLTPKIEKIDDRYRVELYSDGGKFYGMLYYEPVKRGFTNKPISMNSYTCVDATLQKRLVRRFPHHNSRRSAEGTDSPNLSSKWG